jgi:endoglucanase
MRATVASLFIAATAAIGINLGNVLEAPTEGAWAPAAQEYYFDDYVSAGFKVVRIPVRWDEHTGTSPPFAIDGTWMARVETVVGWALARNLTAIINTHHDDWINSESTFSTMLPRFLAVWTQVAARFAAAPPLLRYEVVNELTNLTVNQLNTLYAAVVPVMRGGGGGNAQREIYLGGLSWMSPYWIESNNFSWPPLADGSRDAHLRLEVHSYDPYKFCLQSPPSESRLTPADIQAVDDMYAAMAAWQGQHGRRVLMGECGCQVSAPSRADRLRWYATIGAAQQALADGACLWDDDGSWKIYDRAARTFDEGVLQAVGLKR